MSRRGLGLLLDFTKSPPKRKSSIHHRHSVTALHAEPFLTTPDSTHLASWTTWWKALLLPSSSTAKEPRDASAETQTPSPHKSRFSFLSGDLVLMGGFYGSYLKNATTSIRDWLTLDVLLGFKSTNIALPLDVLLEKNDMKHVADTMLERIGLIDLCSQLVRELKSWEIESRGSFRFDQFAYDWRQDGQTAAQELIECVEKKFLLNGGKPVTIVARKLLFFFN